MTLEEELTAWRHGKDKTLTTRLLCALAELDGNPVRTILEDIEAELWMLVDHEHATSKDLHRERVLASMARRVELVVALVDRADAEASRAE